MDTRREELNSVMVWHKCNWFGCSEMESLSLGYRTFRALKY